MQMKSSTLLRANTAYYGVLQLTHLGVLVRAGMIYLQTGTLPFPASPPTGGWSSQVLPFLFGLGGVDVAAILLGISFAARMLIWDREARNLGLLSLTVAFSSAVVFAVGTILTGAWAAQPIEYGLMVVLFAPLLPLFASLLDAGR